MDQTLPAGPNVERDMAKGDGAARSVLGVAAEKALELSDRATEKAEQLARRSRRKYRRTARKQARKLDKRLGTAAKRLEVAMPVEKRRRRGRRVVLFLVVVGGGIALYLAWRSRQEHGEGQAPEAGPTPDAFAPAVEQSSDEASLSIETRSI